METGELRNVVSEMVSREEELINQKNADYAADNSDALANFYAVERLGLCSAEQGILVRLCDKFKRIINVTNKGTTAVEQETVKDTISDARNYLAILEAVIVDKENSENYSTENNETDDEIKKTENFDIDMDPSDMDENQLRNLVRDISYNCIEEKGDQNEDERIDKDNPVDKVKLLKDREVLKEQRNRLAEVVEEYYSAFNNPEDGTVMNRIGHVDDILEQIDKEKTG